MADVDPNHDNPYAAPKASIAPVAPWNDDPLIPHIASVGWRFVAFVIDYLLILGLTYSLLGLAMILSGHGTPDPFGTTTPDRTFGDGITILCGLLVWMCYFATQESSRWQATPGKRIFRFRVVSLKGTRISFGLGGRPRVRQAIRTGCLLYGTAPGFLHTEATGPARFDRGDRRGARHDGDTDRGRPTADEALNHQRVAPHAGMGFRSMPLPAGS